MNQKSIDLNCDLGEYEQVFAANTDAQIMPFISSCNIACGGHAGNLIVIEHTVSVAQKNRVNIGAHPSYPDRENFGRKVMNLSGANLQQTLQQQILKVKNVTELAGSSLSHVKPHGALYNQAAGDEQLAFLIAEVVATIDSDLLLYGLADSAMAVAAEKVGLDFVAEGFADRTYGEDKALVPRNQTGALITQPQQQFEQAIEMLANHQVRAVTGQMIKVDIDTLCLHGDHPTAIQTAEYLHQKLSESGYTIKPPRC